MKIDMVIIAALAAFFALPAAAAEPQAIVHTSPLPCVPASGGGTFCPHFYDLEYRAEDGDQVLLRLQGFSGIKLDLPPFVREVTTADGRLLRGVPQPGIYIVQMRRDGKHMPTLDMHMRLIPR